MDKAKKHDWKVVLSSDEGTKINEWEFKGINARTLQVKLGKLIKDGIIPKDFYKTKCISVEKDGVASTIGA